MWLWNCSDSVEFADFVFHLHTTNVLNIITMYFRQTQIQNYNYIQLTKDYMEIHTNYNYYRLLTKDYLESMSSCFLVIARITYSNYIPPQILELHIQSAKQILVTIRLVMIHRRHRVQEAIIGSYSMLQMSTYMNLKLTRWCTFSHDRNIKTSGIYFTSCNFCCNSCAIRDDNVTSSI